MNPSASVSADDLLRTFLASVPDLIYFKDRDSRFIAVSRSMSEKHGFAEPGEMVGKTDFDLFTEEHARAAFADEQRIMSDGTLVENKLEKETHTDGSVTWCVTDKQPLRDAAGEIVGTFGVSRDVTASQRVQQQLEATHKQLIDASRRAGMAEVATGVLHNVGNVLNSVNVSADLLSEGLRKSRVDGVTKLSGLLAQAAADLPAFFATERGRQVPAYVTELAGLLNAERERMLTELADLRRSIGHIKDVVAMQQSYACSVALVEPLDPVALLEDSLRLNVAALVRHDVHVVREFEPVPLVCTDRARVLQILVNLVRNAKHALDDGSPKEKLLTLRVGPAGPDMVRLVVADNGVGIPRENLSRIFAHGFTTRKGGHGFGLHSAAVVAGELGGRLTATSSGPGLGAEFVLELPVGAEPGVHAQAASGADDPGTLLVRETTTGV